MKNHTPILARDDITPPLYHVVGNRNRDAARPSRSLPGWEVGRRSTPVKPSSRGLRPVTRLGDRQCPRGVGGLVLYLQRRRERREDQARLGAHPHRIRPPPAAARPRCAARGGEVRGAAPPAG